MRVLEVRAIWLLTAIWLVTAICFVIWLVTAVCFVIWLVTRALSPAMCVVDAPSCRTLRQGAGCRM